MSLQIELTESDIRLRPSSIVGAQTCGFKWAMTYLNGRQGNSNSRAAIGTGIHKAIEVMWSEAIKVGETHPNMPMMEEAAIECFDEEAEKDMRYDDGETTDSCYGEIIAGTKAFVDDLVPFLDIPEKVEQRFTMELDHPVVKDISGSVDYLGGGCLDDVKTSKRKVAPQGHVIQQSIYKMLAEHNGVEVNQNRLQTVVLTKKPYCEILELVPNIAQTKYFVNNLLDKIEILSKDVVPADTLFSCNTKDYLCSPKFCAFHGTCPATIRNANSQEKTKL